LKLAELGIPHAKRRAVWGLSLPNRLAITRELYDILVHQGLELLEKK
jgi:hypothetical protein